MDNGSLALLGLGLVQLGVVGLLYHKLSGAIVRLERQLARQQAGNLSQIEALLSLYAELRPTGGLPATRGWAASPDFLRLLCEQLAELHPATVLECSCGVSTVVLAGWLKRHGAGHVYSLENDARFAEQTRARLRQLGLDAHATVIDAPLVDLELPGWQGRWYDISQLPALPPIELLVIDGPPANSSALARYPAMPVLRSRLAARARLVLDDAARADEQAITARWLVEHAGLTALRAPACEKGVVLLAWAAS